MTSHHGQVFIRIVLLSHLSAFSEAVSLAHLVKAEIVSPYSGILINTGVGNPTIPVGIFFSIKGESQTVTGKALGIQPLIKRPRPYSFFQSQTILPVALSSNTLGSRFQALRTFDNVRFRPSRPMDALLGQ